MQIIAFSAIAMLTGPALAQMAIINFFDSTSIPCGGNSESVVFGPGDSGCLDLTEVAGSPQTFNIAENTCTLSK